MGWNWVEQISKRHQVWLLTTDEFQGQIQAALTPQIHPVFIPSFKRWDWLQKRVIPGLDWLYYYWWQWKAYQVARKLHREVGFDLAHHVTFVSWRAPSFISLLPVPFVWGPVGGGGIPPRSLAGELGWTGRLSEGFRALCHALPRIDPGVRLTMGRAAVILANVQETADLIPKKHRSKVRLMFGIGMPTRDESDRPSPLPESREFTVLFAAQLRPIKGGTLALKAFAGLVRDQPDSKLVMLGEGSERERLEALARDLQVSDKVEFPGWLPHAEVIQWMRKADVLVHPSLRDSGGMVLLEAMSIKKPVVCLDLGGPGYIVTPECGFKVHPGSPDQVVRDIAATLKKLAKEPDLRQKTGSAGSLRVAEQFDWAKRSVAMLDIYESLVGKAQQVPAASPSVQV